MATTATRAGAAHGNHASAAFISDLHLQTSTRKTLAAFERFCAQTGPKFKALYVLGDLFEAYIGDDSLHDACSRRIVGALKRVSTTGTALYFMQGNRDFLVGDGFAQATGATILQDPTVHCIAGTMVLLSHGDAWCTDDEAYQAFRAQARSPAWQAAFLTQPLAQRHALARDMRVQSEHAKGIKSVQIMDVNLNAVFAAARLAKVNMLIHGHTHRPALHHHRLSSAPAKPLDQPELLRRFVLSDWDFDSVGVERGNALLMDAGGARFSALI
jgi:UDP-2,3-diacylglucosamine hydrolase